MHGSIAVKLDVLLSELAGVDRVDIEIPEQHAGQRRLTVGWVVEEIALRLPGLRNALLDPANRKNLFFVVNGAPAQEARELTAGDRVEVFNPFIGG